MREAHTTSHAHAQFGSTIAHATISKAHTRDSLTRALSKWPAVRVASPPEYLSRSVGRVMFFGSAIAPHPPRRG
jgi:hypothetical protein